MKETQKLILIDKKGENNQSHSLTLWENNTQYDYKSNISSSPIEHKE